MGALMEKNRDNPRQGNKTVIAGVQRVLIALSTPAMLWVEGSTEAAGKPHRPARGGRRHRQAVGTVGNNKEVDTPCESTRTSLP